MSSTDQQIISSPPSLIKSLMAGFDATSNHLGLILFSVTLDLLLWFGPRMRLVELFRPFLSGSGALPEIQDPEMTKALVAALEQFNLFSVLRTLPIGVPSLMVSRAVLETPVSVPYLWELSSLGAASLLWLALSAIGLAAGTLYFIAVSQAAILNKIDWRQMFTSWPRAYLQIFYLTLFWFGLFVITVVPFSCLLTILLFTGFNINQVAMVVLLLFAGLLVWMLVPLFFSPHGIFVNQRTMWISVRDSVRLTRMTLPTTSLLLLVILVLSEGLDVLWSTPLPTSWFTLVGIAGHAFVTSSLLAASFIYYRDADRWVQQILQQAKLSVA